MPLFSASRFQAGSKCSIIADAVNAKYMQKLESLFHQATALPTNERESFLKNCCADDDTLLNDILGLLSADTGSTGFLDADTPSSSPVAQSLPHKGDRIGRYKIVRSIGHGNMGQVYKAEDTQLKEQVALKYLSAARANDHTARRRFQAEAEAASSLNHPNICSILDAGETSSDDLYIVMPFYEGHTVSALIEKKIMTVDLALTIAIDVCNGLAAAHEAGIIHRDIKPSNIIVTENKEVKILDFGIAKIAGLDLTRTGTRLGTFAYMAPEQIKGETVDARTDIWALGAMLFEMLTGQRAFTGKDMLDTMHIIIHDHDKPDMSALELPEFDGHTARNEGLRRLLRRALTRDINQRPGNAKVFRDELLQISRC